MKFGEVDITRHYYADGSLKTEWYHKDGPLVGCREYYPDGSLKGERHEVDISGYGRFVDYYPDGSVKSDITYENNQESSRKEYDKREFKKLKVRP